MSVASISLLLILGNEMKYHPLGFNSHPPQAYLLLFFFSSFFEEKTEVNLIHDIVSDMQQQTSSS